MNLDPQLINLWKYLLQKAAHFSSKKGATFQSKNITTSQIKTLLEQNGNLLLQLWSSYNLYREDLGRLPMSSPAIVPAYLLGFHLSNIARIQGLLKRIQSRHNLAHHLEKSPLRIMDIGCGTGAFSQTLLHHLLTFKINPQDISIELFDQSRHFVNAAIEGVQWFHPSLKIMSLKKGLDSSEFRVACAKALSRENETLLLGMTYVWNEILRNPKALRNIEGLLIKILKSKKSALIFVLEPAEKNQSRLSVQIRENIFSMGYTPIYPCPSSQSCPMITDAKNWCYSEWQWDAPEQQKLIDQFLGLSKSKLGASAYVFASPQFSQFKPLEIPTLVGLPTVPKTNKRLQLWCEPNGKLNRQPFKAGKNLPLRGMIQSEVESKS